MPAERQDVPALLQRLAEVLMRLLGERLELARIETRSEVARLLTGLRSALGGALAALVGLTLVALAAVESLRPLIASLGVRLLAVGAPLMLFGARRVVRVVATLTAP